jgi:hypothetical protein
MGFTGNRRIEPISTTSPGQETPPTPQMLETQRLIQQERARLKKEREGDFPENTPGQQPTPQTRSSQGAGENAGRFASPDIGAEQGARQDARQGATRRQTKPLKGYQKYKRERGIKGYKKNPKAYLDYLKTKRKPDDRWKKAAFTSER